MTVERLIAALLAACSLAACGQSEPPEPQGGFAGLGQQAEGFAQVERGRELQFPQDHGPHHGYRIEWWYVTANLKDDQGRDWGAQWTLFRTALRPGEEVEGWESPNLWMAHAALTSPDGHQHAEKLARGGIGQAGAVASPFTAWLDDWSLASVAGSSGIDDVVMQAAGDGFRYSLKLTAQGPLVLHGDRGYSEKSGQGQASYYYSQPFYTVEGTVERDGVEVRVTGNAWLDREWSSQPLASEQEGWDWFSLHLADGAKLMLFQVRQRDGENYRAGTWIGADGSPVALRGEQIEMEALERTRQETGGLVPTRWRVRVVDVGVDVQVAAVESRAWMGTLFPYWEGPVRVDGGEGKGYLEMTGY